MSDWVVIRSPQILREASFSFKPNLFTASSHGRSLAFRNKVSKHSPVHVVGVQKPWFKNRVRVQGFDEGGTVPVLLQNDENENVTSNSAVEESVTVLKTAAKTKKVGKEEILSALSVIEKAKVDPSNFLATLGGSESPGRTWMLVFSAKKKLKSGIYFPVTAVQRFDAVGKRIENGVYFGPFGSIAFEGRISWKKKVLAFIFERLRITLGPLKPLEITLGNQEDGEPTLKDPSFNWFYVDEEIAVARGKSGGTAFWVRCRRVNS